MASVVLFHSVLGLRRVEAKAAERLRGDGHSLIAPDLYGGLTTNSIDDGIEVMRSIGWETICGRARRALEHVPDTAALFGHSMGAGVIGSLWHDRPMCAGVVLLHGLTRLPSNVRAELPVAMHVAHPDPFAPPDDVTAWIVAARKAGVMAQVHRYPSVGHFFTDDALPDYDQEAAEQTWAHVLEFLRVLPSG